MTFAQRFLLSLAIVLAALFGLSLCGYNYWDVQEQKTGLIEYILASAESQQVECMDEPTRERIRAIMIDALDEALKDQIKHLFETWMKDERGQPGRAATGARQAIKAHQGARKSALEWMPPPCAG